MKKLICKTSSQQCAVPPGGRKDSRSPLRGLLLTDIENERWVSVEGYEGMYVVSDYGRMRSLDRLVQTPRGGKFIRGCFLRPLKHTGGYLRAMFWKNGTARQVYVHTVVLETFHSKRPDARMQVAHSDGDQKNNKLSNLRWVTPSENQADREHHGTGRVGRPKKCNRLTPEDVAQLREDYLGKRLNITQLAKLHGFARTTVADVVNFRTHW